MKIGEEVVVLPSEDPVFFDLSWRYKLADAAIRQKTRSALPSGLRKDPVISLWSRFLRDPSKVSRAARLKCEQVFLWRNSQIAALLEPLLMCDCGFETIAADLGGLDPALVAFYANSFFAVRTEAGEVRPVHLLRARFDEELRTANPEELPVILKRSALVGGRALLMCSWNVQRSQAGTDNTKSDPDTIKALVQNELMQRVVQGRVPTRDLVRIEQLQVARERLEFETRPPEYEDEARKVMLRILSLIVPPKAPPPPVDEDAYNSGLHARLQAEKNIAAQKIEDRGPAAGAVALSESIRQAVGEA